LTIWAKLVSLKIVIDSSATIEYHHHAASKKERDENPLLTLALIIANN